MNFLWLIFNHTKCICVRSRRCSCLVTWFCHQLIAKPGNKTAAPLWPDSFEDFVFKTSHFFFQGERLPLRFLCLETKSLSSVGWLAWNAAYAPWRNRNNPLRAKFLRENINIYLHFMSFLHIYKTQVAEIPPRVRQGPAYSTWSISWLLMSWRRNHDIDIVKPS